MRKATPHKPVTSRPLLIWSGVILILLLLIGAGTGYTMHRKHEMRQAALAQGLDEITILHQTETGQTKKLNITQTVLDILSTSLSKKGRLDSTAKRQINNLSIQDIQFPPMPEKQLKTYETSKSAEIAEYFQTVYNVLNTKHADVTVKNITRKALERRDKNEPIKGLIEINKAMYYDLMDVRVPQPTLKVHKNYIRIIQVQHHFLQSLANQEKDPLNTQTSYLITLRFLEDLRPELNTEIKTLEKEYDLNLQNQSTSNNQSSNQ